VGSSQSVSQSVNQSNRRRRRRPFESGGQNFEALGAWGPGGPPSLTGPASTLVLSETESANPQTTPKLSWPSLRTTRDVIGKARYKDPSPVTIRLPFPIFGWQTFAIPSSSLLVSSCVFFFRLTPLSRSLFLSWELGRSLGQPTLRLR
jgi:hypothetical protein